MTEHDYSFDQESQSVVIPALSRKEVVSACPMCAQSGGMLVMGFVHLPLFATSTDEASFTPRMAVLRCANCGFSPLLDMDTLTRE